MSHEDAFCDAEAGRELFLAELRAAAEAERPAPIVDPNELVDVIAILAIEFARKAPSQVLFLLTTLEELNREPVRTVLANPVAWLRARGKQVPRDAEVEVKAATPPALPAP